MNAQHRALYMRTAEACTRAVDLWFESRWLAKLGRATELRWNADAVRGCAVIGCLDELGSVFAANEPARALVEYVAHVCPNATWLMFAGAMRSKFGSRWFERERLN